MKADISVFGASRTIVDLIRGESRHGLIVAIESKSIASVADSEDAREEAAVVHILSQRNIRRTGRGSGTRQPRSSRRPRFLTEAQHADMRGSENKDTLVLPHTI